MNQVFYRGVVEDNNDPEKLGRLRVRIFGLHSDDLELLPTEQLPWCEVAHSLENGFISGIGKSYVAQNGTYVWCFLDNFNENKAIVFASCPGISHEKESGAFSDKSGTYPLDDRLEESDFNRLARNEKIDETECEKLITDNRVTGVSTADGDSWDEPESNNSKTQYPFNNVTETASGHVIQLDDTEGNERIQIFHKSGGYIEIKPDGNIVIKGIGDLFEILKGNLKQNVALKSDITINGDKSEMIGGAFNQSIGKDETREITGLHDLTIGKSSSISISEGGLYNCGKEMTLKAGTEGKIETSTNLEVKAGANGKIEASANLEVKAGAITEIKGTLIKLN